MIMKSTLSTLKQLIGTTSIEKQESNILKWINITKTDDMEGLGVPTILFEIFCWLIFKWKHQVVKGYQGTISIIYVECLRGILSEPLASTIFSDANQTGEISAQHVVYVWARHYGERIHVLSIKYQCTVIAKQLCGYTS